MSRSSDIRRRRRSEEARLLSHLRRTVGPALSAAVKKKKKGKLTFKYQATVTRTSDQNGSPVRRDVQKKISKSNQITYKNLKPGNYTANYTVILFRGKGTAAKQVGKTAPSPDATFNIS